MGETMLDRPMLVIGAPRSGKSLVTNVFRSAEEFCVLGEALMTWNLGMGSRPDDRRLAEEANEKIREQIVESCLNQIRMRGGEKTRYLDNLAYNALRVPFLHALLPEARLILVVRDAKSVIPEMHYYWTAKASMRTALRRTREGLHWQTLPRIAGRFAVNYITSRVRKRRATWGPVVPGLGEFAAKHSAAETAAFQWLRLNEIALSDLKQLPADRWILTSIRRSHEQPRRKHPPDRRLRRGARSGEGGGLRGQLYRPLQRSRICCESIRGAQRERMALYPRDG